MPFRKRVDKVIQIITYRTPNELILSSPTLSFPHQKTFSLKTSFSVNAQHHRLGVQTRKKPIRAGPVRYRLRCATGRCADAFKLKTNPIHRASCWR